jgi:hypothetical protein
MARPKTAPEPKTAPKTKTAKPSRRTTPKTAKAAPKKSKDVSPPPVFRYCSFCRKPQETRKRLIAGPNNIFICDECVEVCVSVLFEEDKDDWTTRLNELLSGKNKFKTEMHKTKGDKK